MNKDVHKLSISSDDSGLSSTPGDINLSTREKSVGLKTENVYLRPLGVSPEARNVFFADFFFIPLTLVFLIRGSSNA